MVASSSGRLANIIRRGLLKDHLDSQEGQKNGERGLGMLEDQSGPKSGSSYEEGGASREGDASCSPTMCPLLEFPSARRGCKFPCRSLIKIPSRPHPIEIDSSSTEFKVELR